MLHRLLENLGVPQLPNVFTVDRLEQANLKEVDEFVNTYLVGPDAIECVLKPTHLSNANGVLSLSEVPPHEHEQAVNFITQHMQDYMCRKAGANESIAMRSLQPGFVGQPKYKSVVAFDTPLELRVIVLWGKARLAVWWWGRSDSPGEHPNRNAWLVRRPRRVGEISDNDDWKAIHNHIGHNPGFDKALELFERHMSAMALTSEVVATAFGAPFLRIDFFVGSPRWGIRLNEVAYGCGCDYRNLGDDGRIVSDSQAVSQIIVEGMRGCQKCYPPEYFLSRLGMFGPTYGQSSISKLKSSLRPTLPAATLCDESEHQRTCNCWDCSMSDNLCKTMKDEAWMTIRPSLKSFSPPPQVCGFRALSPNMRHSLPRDRMLQCHSSGPADISRCGRSATPLQCHSSGPADISRCGRSVTPQAALRQHRSCSAGRCIYPSAVQASRQASCRRVQALTVVN